MAVLIKYYQLPNKLIATNVYLRIENMGGNKENITLDVAFYVSQDDAVKGTPPIDRRSFVLIPDLSETSKNFFIQGYNLIKSMSEFEGAIDVYEEGA